MAAGGGAWKVAYADFVTAMMAFFLVMWITSQSADVKKAIGGYFNDPWGSFSETTTSDVKAPTGLKGDMPLADNARRHSAPTLGHRRTLDNATRFGGPGAASVWQQKNEAIHVLAADKNLPSLIVKFSDAETFRRAFERRSEEAYRPAAGSGRQAEPDRTAISLHAAPTAEEQPVPRPLAIVLRT